MVAITVVMAAVIAGFVYGYIGTTEKVPNVALSVMDNPAVHGDNTTGAIILKDQAGDFVPVDDWEYGVAQNKDAPISSWTGGTDNLTAGYSVTIDAAAAPGWNHVVVKHIPSKSVLLDTNIQVR
jgi:FlaG/FlaF family flagellin (archaellin)